MEEFFFSSNLYFSFTNEPSLFPTLVWIPPPIELISSTSNITWYDFVLVSILVDVDEKINTNLVQNSARTKTKLTRAINDRFDWFEAAHFDQLFSHLIHLFEHLLETARLEYVRAHDCLQVLFVCSKQTLKLHAFHVRLIN